MKKIILLLAAVLSVTVASAQRKSLGNLYDENINTVTQIREAVSKAQRGNKNVICQVGANWCKWCYRFNDFIKNDAELMKYVEDNYVYIHVNANPKDANYEATMKMLGNPRRFGLPCLVVLNPEGKEIHIQDSSYLESGESYDKDKVMRFLKNWRPE